MGRTHPRWNSLPWKVFRGVQIFIASFTPEAQEDGLTKAVLQTTVEKILRTHGVPILTQSERWATKSAPFLNVQVDLLPSGDFYALSTQMKLHQKISLIHTSNSQAVFAVTWQVGMVGRYSKTRIKDIIPDMVEPMALQFVKDYRTVNSQTPVGSPFEVEGEQKNVEVWLQLEERESPIQRGRSKDISLEVAGSLKGKDENMMGEALSPASLNPDMPGAHPEDSENPGLNADNIFPLTRDEHRLLLEMPDLTITK